MQPDELLRPVCAKMLRAVVSLAALLATFSSTASAELVISEILLNPPGTDAPNQYVELRGTPAALLPSGTYLVAVDGNANGNPGCILNVFDLSLRKLGNNGCLVLLEKTNLYAPDSNSTALTNTKGTGFGNGATSSIGHYGYNGLTDLPHPSVTFFLAQTPNRPGVGQDIDANNDGVPDGAEFARWSVLDSVGVLDADGAGDFAYGAANFRRDSAPGNGAKAPGLVIPVNFTPRYIARATGPPVASATNWIGGDSLEGSAPSWRLGSAANTLPTRLAGAPLNHLGVPNTWEKDHLLLAEIVANPPGTNDALYEYLEFRGTPGSLVSNTWILVLQGESSQNPGRIEYAANLSGLRVGANGCIVLAAPECALTFPASATAVADSSWGGSDGAFKNQTTSFLLVSTASSFAAGTDLDSGDNGVLEGLPPDCVILDAVGWSSGGNNDIVYGGVVLKFKSGVPDAATRFLWDDTPNWSAAWFWGDLLEQEGGSIYYDAQSASGNLPPGSMLTPGAPNRPAPAIDVEQLVSGVIGDPSNPPLKINVATTVSGNPQLTVTARSSNASVVPDGNLAVTPVGTTGTKNFDLRLAPIGVGYADITIYASDGFVTGRLVVPYAASAPGRLGGAWHVGASDGSTAIPLDPDFMLVGDDENQTLRLYPRQHSDLPSTLFDMTGFLQLPDVESGLPREVDVEASTRVGDLAIWMGSHGHAQIGEPRTNRTRIFSTRISDQGAGTQLTYVGRYDYLKVDLIAWDNLNLHGKGTNYYGIEASDAPGIPPKAEDGSGFAIEGLAMMPGSTNGAYVAFRAPIIPPANRDYALLVPVLNFVDLATRGGSADSCVFGPPIEMDLYGRGIRSIEGNANGYLIVAGPAPAGIGPYPADFRLYTWTGRPADPPDLRTADLSGLNPEGIIGLPNGPWTPQSRVELLSDCGSLVLYGDDIPAKRLEIQNFKKCRSDSVTLGEITPPPPIITGFVAKGATCEIKWRALKGATYRLQSASSLSLADWTDIGPDILASSPHSAQEVPQQGTSRFYRVLFVNYQITNSLTL